MAVNITSMQLKSVADRTLVQVNFTWSPLANKSVVSYNVTAQMLNGEEKLLVSILETSRPYIVLNLEQNQLYTVQVRLRFPYSWIVLCEVRSLTTENRYV